MSVTTPHVQTREEVEKHNRGLLHALQTAHPVLLNGVKHFIQTITYNEGNGGIEAIVYLRGRREPVAPNELAPDPHHDARGSINSNNERESPNVVDIS